MCSSGLAIREYTTGFCVSISCCAVKKITSPSCWTGSSFCPNQGFCVYVYLAATIFERLHRHLQIARVTKGSRIYFDYTTPNVPRSQGLILGWTLQK